ncbi:hypothetical protein RTBOTA2_003110 [Rhodotorula toruloides]|nr:hypothetical protein RTBOTA2_003110 [Rhodotorula toruloides]
MSILATNSRSDRTPPTTLEDALSRIRELEDTLEAARQVWRAEGKGDLEEAIRRYRSTGQAGVEGQASSSTAATPPSSSSIRNPTHSDTSNTVPKSTHPTALGVDPEASDGPSPAAPEPVDIGPFVLRALALRKSAQVGSIDEDKVEEEFEAIVEGAGLSEEQKA